MTQPIDRKTILCMGGLALGLIVAVLWSYGQLRTSHAAAEMAATDLAACRRIVHRMQSLNTQPTMAHSRQIHLNELTRHIEQSTKNAQIAPDSLVRIWPDPAIRVGDSPYQKKSTQVLFRQVTLRQFITFLHHVAAQEGGPRATRIRLFTPRGIESGNRWTAETTLTYLIYAPKI